MSGLVGKTACHPRVQALGVFSATTGKGNPHTGYRERGYQRTIVIEGSPEIAGLYFVSTEGALRIFRDKLGKQGYYRYSYFSQRVRNSTKNVERLFQV